MIAPDRPRFEGSEAPWLDQEVLLERLRRADWLFPTRENAFSPSQFWCYFTCPACYEAQYVARIPRRVSADLLIGRGVHKALATARRHIREGRDPRNQDELKHAEEAGVGEFEVCVFEGREDVQPGETFEIEVDLTKKYKSLDECRDLTAKLSVYGVQRMAAYDLEAGIEAVEARAWGIGTPLDDAEAAAMKGAGLRPALPFKTRGYLDVRYKTGVLKDAKTSTRKERPDPAAVVQVCMYGLTGYVNDIPELLGIDQLVKTKTPAYQVYWLGKDGVVSPDGFEYVRALVLDVADKIGRGYFPPRPSFMCRYTHGFPPVEPAASWPGMDPA